MFTKHLIHRRCQAIATILIKVYNPVKFASEGKNVKVPKERLKRKATGILMWSRFHQVEAGTSKITTNSSIWDRLRSIKKLNGSEGKSHTD